MAQAHVELTTKTIELMQAEYQQDGGTSGARARSGKH